MLSERTIINGLILTVGLILGPYLVVSVLEGNEAPLLIFVGFAFLLLVFFVIRDAICLFPLLGYFYIGHLNFIPLGFSPLEVFSFVLVFYYGVTYLAMRQRPIRPGPFRFLVPLLVIAAIVIYHDSSFGLRVLGSSQEGSRPALLITISIITYLCGINIPTPPLAALRWLPWGCCFMAILCNIPYILTTYIPSSAPFFYHFTDQVNVGAYLESSIGTSDDDQMSRQGHLTIIGMGVQMLLVSHFPIYTWWRPDRWWVALLSLLSLGFMLAGGYRSNLMLFFLGTLIATLCYSRWFPLILVPGLILVGLGISFVQENHPWGLEIPLSAQRALSILPGQWDRDAVENASSSNEFRNSIQRVYIRDYLYKSPWLGNGFTFDPEEEEAALSALNTEGNANGDTEARAYIISKAFHVGWISLYDGIGLVGGAAFVIFGLNVFRTSLHFIFQRSVNRDSSLFPLQVWIFGNITQILVGYFTVFGDMRSAIPSLCAYAIVLSQLDKIERRGGFEKIPLNHEKSLSHAGPGRLSPA